MLTTHEHLPQRMPMLMAPPTCNLVRAHAHGNPTCNTNPAQKVVERLSPSDEAIETVSNFLLESGAYDIHLNKVRTLPFALNLPLATNQPITHTHVQIQMRDVVSVEVAGDVAEQMLSTELYHYSHKTYRGVDLVRAGAQVQSPPAS